MAASQGNDPLGDFGKLPAEIRVEIYKLCPITKWRIVITRVVKRGVERFDACGRLEKRPGSTTVKGVLCSRPLGRNRFGPIQPHLAADLLQASKVLDQEASSILYRYNTFEFKSATAFSVFFRKAGRHAPWLTDVMISNVNEKSNPKHVELLPKLERPKRLRINLEPKEGYKVFRQFDSRSFVDPSQIWPLIKPFVLHSAHEPLPSSQTTSGTTFLTQGQIARFSMIEIDISHIRFVRTSDGSDEVCNGDDSHRKATFRKIMLEVIRKDLQEEGGHQALIPELKGEERRCFRPERWSDER